MSYERFRYEMPTRDFQEAWASGTYTPEHAEHFSEEPDERMMQYTPQASPQMVPVEMRAPGEPYDPDTLSFTYIAEFNFGDKCEPVDVDIREEDLVALWARNNQTKHLKYDLQRAIPLSIQIVGSTIKQPAPFSVQVFDGAGLPLFDSHGANSSSGESNCNYGWPLYIDDKNVYRSTGKIPKYYRDYANVKMEDIKRDVLQMDYRDGNKFYLIPRKIGFYYAWVINVIGKRDRNIMTEECFQDPNHRDFIRLTVQDFNRCVKHYEDVLEKIKFHNMQKITVRLIPHCKRIDENELYSLVLNFTIRAGEASPELVKHRLTNTKAPHIGGAAPKKHHSMSHSYERLRGAYGKK